MSQAKLSTVKEFFQFQFTVKEFFQFQLHGKSH